MTAMASVSAEMSITRSWQVHGTALALLVVITLLSFFGSVADAVQVWWVYPTYSHCFLIIPISLWLIWEKRETLGSISPAVELRALWAVPVLLLVWWMGELATINEVRQFAIVALIQVAIVAMLGLRVYRQIWFAAMYLFFLVPTGQYLIAPMQRFAAEFADISLSLIGIPHHTEGTLIELTNGTFEVAEACAGLRFLIATVALGVLFAYMMFRKWYKIVLFLVACVVVPLIGNGLRVVGIILLAHYTNNEYGIGADHLVYGWGFNVAILLVLFFLGSFFRDQIADPKNAPAQAAPAEPMAKTFAAFLAIAVLTLAGPALARWQQNRPAEPHVAGLLSPTKLAGWRTADLTDDWQPEYGGADAQLKVSLTPEDRVLGPSVDLYVVYYARAQAAHALTAHLNHLWNGDVWTLVGTQRRAVPVRWGTMDMQESIITSSTGRRMVWSSYWIDGRFATNSYSVKLLQIPAALSGREGQAIVAVSTAVEATDDDARARLSSVMMALQDLPGRLNSVNRDGDSTGSN